MMTTEDHRESEEQQLQALFDSTAEEPAQAQLDRLARFAAQVPEAGKPARWWWRRIAIVLVPAAAVAIGAWVFLHADRALGPVAVGPSASPLRVAEEDLYDDPTAATLGDDPLGGLDGGNGGSLASLDVMYGPDENAANLSDWLEVYEELLEEEG